MNRILTVVAAAAAFLVAVVSAAPALAQAGSASVEEQIKKIENDRAAAVVKGDAAAVARQTSDDYTFINLNGQVSGKTQTIDGLKSGSIKITSNELSDLKVRVYGDTAVVTGKSNAKGVVNGREIKSPVMFTRVYVKKDGRWQVVAFQQTSINP